MSTAREVDVLVIGGNPGGCAAAISAARSGRSVVLLEATATLGGMNANGTFGFDCGTPQALSGIAEEIEARIRRHYEQVGLRDPLFDRREDLVWESHVAALAWTQVASETHGLEVLTRAVPVGVRCEGAHIHEVQWQAAEDLMGNPDPRGAICSIHARIVIDASYEADVAAWAGVPFRLGREGRTDEEPHAGSIFFSNTHSHPEAGYLAHSVLPGSTGKGDDAIMAFAYRLHCRIYQDPSPLAPHRIKAPPPGYDAQRYEWSAIERDRHGHPVYFNTLYVLVNGKFLLNRMVRGNNLVGSNREYVLAHPRDRKMLRQEFIDHALGYLYFIQNEGGMPELGLANDEFRDNANMPYQIYVREARRIIGMQTMTEADVNPFLRGDGVRPPAKPDAIAIGDWTYESQGCADEAPPGYPYPDGYIIGRVSRAPYQLPYGCMVPQSVDNLLVCGGISATHIAMGATRVEATRIQLGIAAGIAAVKSLERDEAPKDVPVRSIQREIIRRGGKLVFFADVPSSHIHAQAIQWAALRGWVPHDEDLAFRPDDILYWEDFAEAVVRVAGLPISVTGLHFEDVGRRDPCFRFFETLYDLGTRHGVDLFGVRRLVEGDPMKDFLRLLPMPRLLRGRPRHAVTPAEAIDLICGLLACGLRGTQPGAMRCSTLSRGALCLMLYETFQSTDDSGIQTPFPADEQH